MPSRWASTGSTTSITASSTGVAAGNAVKRSRDFSQLVGASGARAGLHAADGSDLTWADVRPDPKRVRGDGSSSSSSSGVAAAAAPAAAVAHRVAPSVHPSRRRAVEAATRFSSSSTSSTSTGHRTMLPPLSVSSSAPRDASASGTNSMPIGGGETLEEAAAAAEEAPAIKAEFGLSGALAEDASHGNVYRGVVMKFSEPADARKPTKKWRLYVFKGDAEVAVLHISRQSAYLVGRDAKVADIKALHPSLSKQHAVIQFRMRPKRKVSAVEAMVDGAQFDVLPYVIDLESTNGTKLNGKKIDPACYVELRVRDKLNFGNSSRDYVLLHDEMV